MARVDAVLRTVQLNIGLVGAPDDARRLLDRVYDSTMDRRPEWLEGVGSSFVDFQLDPSLRIRSRSLEWSGFPDWHGFAIGCDWVVMPSAPHHRALLERLVRQVDALVLIPGTKSTQLMRRLEALETDRSLHDIPMLVHHHALPVDVLRAKAVALAQESLGAGYARRGEHGTLCRAAK